MNAQNLFIPIILGTAREGRRSEAAARFVLAQAQTYGQFETEMFDVRDYAIVPKTERNGKEATDLPWAKVMARADGLIIVAPEYNHGYPGELKFMLDQAYVEYNRKPAAICGVGGGLGGGRMVEGLRTVLLELQMVPVRNAIYFSNPWNLFDAQGAINDPSYAEKLKIMFDELLWYARALKTAREMK